MSDTSSLPHPASGEIQRLYEINQALLLAQDTADVLLTLKAVLANDARTLLHIHVNEDGGGILEAVIDSQGEQMPGEPLPGRFATTAGGDRVRIIPDVAVDASSTAQIAARFGGHSAIEIALLEGFVLRDLLVITYDAVPTIDAGQRRLYDAFATQAALIMQNLRLLQSTRASNQRLSRQVAVLENLRALSDAVSSQNDDTQVMTLTMKTLVEITGADHAGVVLINPDGVTGTVVSEYPESGVIGVEISLQDNPVFTELLIGRKSSLLIPDVETDALITPGVRQLLTGLGTKALIIAPLQIGSTLIGSVGLDLYTTQRQFTPNTLELVETLSAQLAIYLENLRTRRERERATEQVRVLDQIGSRFLALNRVDDLLAEAARGLQTFLHSDRVIIRLGDPEDGEGMSS